MKYIYQFGLSHPHHMFKLVVFKVSMVDPPFQPGFRGLVAIADLSCGLLVEMDFDRDGL